MTAGSTDQANQGIGRIMNTAREVVAVKTDSGCERPITVLSLKLKSKATKKKMEYSFVYKSAEIRKISENLKANGIVSRKNTFSK